MSLELQNSVAEVAKQRRAVKLQLAVTLAQSVPEEQARVCYDSLVHFVDAWQEEPPREFELRRRRAIWEDVVCNEHDVPDQTYLRQESIHMVQQALGSLEHNEALVLIGRYFDDRTLEDVAGDFGVSRERIRQIESQALRKLRSKYTDSIMYDYFVAERDPKIPCNSTSGLDSDEFVQTSATIEKPVAGVVDGSWLSVQDVASQLNIAPEKVETLVQQGELVQVPGMRQNWFTPKVVKRYLDKVSGIAQEQARGFGHVSWLSILDVATRLQMAPSTVQSFIRKGELRKVPGTSQTWVTPQELRAFQKTRKLQNKALGCAQKA